MYDRPFGVEIECSSGGKGREFTRTLLNQHIPNAHKWSIGYDGTELEIKSPILRGTDGMRNLKQVMNLLEKNGFYTTDCDGMHCHFDAHDLNESDMIRVIKSWDNNQDIIAKFLGERFDNDFCTPYSDYAIKTMERERGGLWYYDGDKCHAIEPRQRFGTLEFRQHYGTINFEDAKAWILLVQAFIKTVAKRKSPLTRVTMEDLFRLTRVYKVAQRNLVEREYNFSRSGNPWKDYDYEY